MINDPPGAFCSHRLFEWTMAIAMTLFGWHVVLFPSTMVQSRYVGVLLILPMSTFAVLCVIIGTCRIIALSRNGHWPEWGPHIRAFTALTAAVLWAQLAVSLAQYASPGMWVYAVLAGAEFRSVWRARRDANGPKYL